MVLLRCAEKTTGMSADSNEKKELTSSFSVDQDYGSTEAVPGVTKLLNRKSFASSSSSSSTSAPSFKPEPASEAAPEAPVAAPLQAQPEGQNEATVVMSGPPSAGIEIAISEAPQAIAKAPEAAPSTGSAGLVGKIQKLTRRNKIDSKPLLNWTREDLQAGTDPLGKALVSLIDSGVTRALFLGIQATPGSSSPVFVSSAAVNAGTKATLWTGLRWDPQILPDIWNQLVTAGYVELPPPGTMTNLHSSRNVSRSAFDIGNEDCLVLARVGTAQYCRGILVLTSRKSLIGPVKMVLPLLGAAPVAGAKTAGGGAAATAKKSA